ncbi:MAG: hypothetical protein AAF597_01230 [Bacteroidota bacterium]
MAQVIKLRYGDTAEFHDDHIFINDKNAKRSHWVSVISGLALIPFGILMLDRGGFDVNQVETWLGGLILVANLIGAPWRIFKISWREVIPLAEVKSAKVSPGMLNAVLTLKLKNGKQRLLRSKWEHAKDFEVYFGTQNLLV